MFKELSAIASSGYRWTALEMDGLRVTKIRVQPEKYTGPHPLPKLRQKSG